MVTSNVVISADTPVIKEIIKDQYNGFLFKTGEPDSLKKVIQNVIKLPSNVLQKIAFEAYQTASKFTYSKRAKEIFNFLKEFFYENPFSKK
jgi:glycosyltransferase involved in cell wall biosynthesis